MDPASRLDLSSSFFRIGRCSGVNLTFRDSGLPWLFVHTVFLFHFAKCFMWSVMCISEKFSSFDKTAYFLHKGENFQVRYRSDPLFPCGLSSLASFIHLLLHLAYIW